MNKKKLFGALAIIATAALVEVLNVREEKRIAEIRRYPWMYDRDGKLVYPEK